MRWVGDTIAKRPRWGVSGHRRSYVLEPQQRVTDHLTGIVRHDAEAVLEGEIDELLRAGLAARGA
jgi:protein subunit release factor B